MSRGININPHGSGDTLELNLISVNIRKNNPNHSHPHILLNAPSILIDNQSTYPISSLTMMSRLALSMNDYSIASKMLQFSSMLLSC